MKFTIEYKISESGNVHTLFSYDEKMNAMAKACGAIFAQYPTRKGWKFATLEAFQGFQANAPRARYGCEIEWVDGNAPKVEAPNVEAHGEIRTVDGEARMAMAFDAMGL